MQKIKPSKWLFMRVHCSWGVKDNVYNHACRVESIFWALQEYNSHIKLFRGRVNTVGTKELAVWRGYFCIYIRSCDLPVWGEYLLWWPGYLVLSREGWPPVMCPNWENSIFHLFIYILPPGFLSFSDSVCLIVLLPLCLADWSLASPCHLLFFLFSSLNFSSYLLSLPESSAYTGTGIRIEPNTTGGGQWNDP